MSSERQVEANRRNAARSTGPRSPEGKQAVRSNAVKHSLLSREVLVPGEDSAALAELSERMHHAWQPVGEWEDVLVDRIVQALWRLRRIGRVEAGVFSAAYYEHVSMKASAEVRLHTRHILDNGHDLTMVTDKAAHDAALKKKKEAENLAEGEVPSLGRAFFSKERTFATLSRYETAIERGMFKALHELQRLQAARAGVVVPPPVVAEVDVDVVVWGAGQEICSEEPIVDLRNKAIRGTNGEDSA
jgi:hypothetical protein